jgi:hypothetical protein
VIGEGVYGRLHLMAFGFLHLVLIGILLYSNWS